MGVIRTECRRKEIGPKKEEVTGGCTKLNNETLEATYYEIPRREQRAKKKS